MAAPPTGEHAGTGLGVGLPAAYVDAEPNLKFTKAYEVYSSRFQKEDFGEEGASTRRSCPSDT